MNIISYANNTSEIDQLIASGINEIIISCQELSRFNKSTIAELENILNNQSKYSVKLTLEWDALYQENNFNKAISYFKKLPVHEIKNIRVQDPGVVHFIKENYPWMKIQLILETGNHNLVGLKRWCEYLGDQLERLILSNELSKTHLETYAKELSIPIEVLVFGRILLFYSPRKLLSPINKDTNPYIEMSGTSEESPHSGFPLIENSHGSFMFNVKDLSLIEHAKELIGLNIKNVRIDLRFDNFIESSKDIVNALLQQNTEFSIKGPRPFIKGFYNINKSDVLFVKLKNKKIIRNDENYFGEIIDVERDSQICIMIKKDLDSIIGKKIMLVTPEGKIKYSILNKVTNTSFQELTNIKNAMIVLIPYIRGVTVKTQIYLDSSTK